MSRLVGLINTSPSSAVSGLYGSRHTRTLRSERGSLSRERVTRENGDKKAIFSLTRFPSEVFHTRRPSDYIAPHLYFLFVLKAINFEESRRPTTEYYRYKDIFKSIGLASVYVVREIPEHLHRTMFATFKKIPQIS